MAITVALSAKRNHLVFTETTFRDGIQDGDRKLGILAIEDSSKAEATLAKAQNMKWSFGLEMDEAGFYPVIRD